MKMKKKITKGLTFGIILALVTGYIIYIREGMDVLIDSGLHWVFGSLVFIGIFAAIVKKYQNKPLMR